MGLIRLCITAVICVFVTVTTLSQKLYYPADASQLLKSTADDMAMLLQKAGTGKIIPEAYTTMPSSGIILNYDASIKNNQSCKVISDGNSFIQFTAAEDNGLNFGVYQYIQQLGFRFYQPGTIWEIIPALQSPYKKIDTLYSSKFRYKNWFISGGYSNWVMDTKNDYGWDMYAGENGHNWALYMRRNNMLGASRFAGHRDDVLTPDYLTTLKNNPCYVAPYNGSREATGQSVPDVNNIAAMQLWAAGIEQKYTGFKNTVFSKPGVYANYLHNFTYNYAQIGIEVPDGAHWANSIDKSACGTNDYLKESDQHFTLANFTAAKISTLYPGKHFQLYAYDGHADVPSTKISINENIDVQVVPTAFQSETSPKGLLNRWYNRTKNISEYHYLNLPQWTGETPSFYLNDLKTTIQRIKEKQGQGIVWEASPSKFVSLPFLLAANASLKDDVQIDSVLLEFCNAMFSTGAGTVYKLLQCWSNDKTVTVTNGIQDNKYKLPYYFSLVKQVETETANAPAIVKERIGELKAYLHYLQIYYSWSFDQRQPAAKADKAAALCLYLAKISKLQIVNSYFLIQDIIWKYNTADDIFVQYNLNNGTAYKNGALLPVSAAEIEANFIDDAADQSYIQQFSFQDAAEIKNQFETKNLEVIEKINVKINYTYGKDYGTRTEFYFIASAAGSFSIKYSPLFDFPDKGYINFTVESTDKTLGIVKDFSIGRNNSAGIIYIPIPAAGTYKLSIVSKYKSAVELIINTNGNYFYKNGPYLGNTIENYRGDLLSLPGYFYVPKGINRIYFSLNNSYSAINGFAPANEISKIFVFRDNNNMAIQPKLVSQSDSALFYLDVPAGSDGSFFQVFKMEGYQLCFSNISNVQWYGRRKGCTTTDFTASIKNVSGQCITELKAIGAGNDIRWEVYDALKWYYYNTNIVDLPENISPNAIVTLTTGGNCTVKKRIGDNPDYLKQKTSCATGAPVVEPSTKVVVYPNPGKGIFMCMQNGEAVLAEDIKIYNMIGAKVASFANTQNFAITQFAAGMYVYSIVINRISYTGKLVKL